MAKQNNFKKIPNPAEPRIFSKITGILVAFIGLAVLLGWAYHITILKSVIPGFVSMKPNTALAFIFVGLALVSFEYNKKAVSAVLASAAALIGILTIVEYIFNLRLGIDEFLFKDDIGAVLTVFSGRMAIMTASNFFVIGVGILFAVFGRKKISDWILQIAMASSVLSFLGYLFDVKEFYKLGGIQITAMALHTAIVFILIIIGIIFSGMEEGAFGVFAGKGIVAIYLRRAIFGVSFVVVAVGWLINEGADHFNFYGQSFQDALEIMLVLISSLIILYSTANSLTSAEKTRTTVENEAVERRKEYDIRLEREKKELEKLANELKDKNDQLEKTNKIMIGRELKMVELKNKVEELEKGIK